MSIYWFSLHEVQTTNFSSVDNDDSITKHFVWTKHNHLNLWILFNSFSSPASLLSSVDRYRFPGDCMFSYARYVMLNRKNIIEGTITLQKFTAMSFFCFQRSPEKPCLNDVTEVGTWRKAAVTLAVFLVVLTLLPVWDELAEELGIGLVTTFWHKIHSVNSIFKRNEGRL